MSSVSSARAKAAATLARLAAEASSLQALKVIEEEQLRLSQRKRDCELQMEIAKARAEEAVLRDIEEQSSCESLHPPELRLETTPTEKVGQWLTTTPHDKSPSDAGKPVLENADMSELPAPGQVKGQMQLVPGPVDVPVQLVKHEVSPLDLQRVMIDTMQLPKCELAKFNGDPLQYWLFTRSFDAAVGDTYVSPSVKLNRLCHYCEGEALSVIQSCLVMEPQLGYTKARELLRERFGNDYRISEAWVRKLTEGPRVLPGERKAIQQLADDLQSCTLALRAMNQLEEIDTRRSLGVIVKRLPQYLQSKWRTTAVNNLEETGRYPGIEKLVQFLMKSAREANDPVYGFKDTRERPNTPKKASNFNVQASGTPRPPQTKGKTEEAKPPRKPGCPLCTGNHGLDVCTDFVKMTLPERLTIARDKRVCFNCLSGSHFSRKCSRGPCGVQGCTSWHSKMLHGSFGRVKEESKKGEADPAGTSLACGGMQLPVKVALPVVAVMVRGTDQRDWIKTHALLDPGSNRSFCSMTLVKKLNLRGSSRSMSLNTLSSSSPIKTQVVSVEVTAAKETGSVKPFQLPRVHAMCNFPELCDSCVTADEIQRHGHLDGIPVPQVAKEGVMLLIGQDAPHLLAPLEVRSGGEGEPYAVRTVLGWTINGPLEGGTPAPVRSNFVQESLDAQVERLWRMDAGDSLSVDSPSHSVNDQKALHIWDDSVQSVDGHYHLAIPFKADNPHLTDNKVLAEKRLSMLGRRLVKNHELKDRYAAEINNLVSKGFAEKVPEDDLAGPPGRTWYLPHHGVLNPNKPDKLRVVFDCAAKYQGRSLNDVVLQGPDLTNKLIGVLLRFREGQVALMADIEQMFHQVGVTKEHRDVLRFIWWHNDDLSKHMEVYRMKVHLFGGVWSPSCANYALLKVADDYGDVFDAEVGKTVRSNFYVDDCLKSVRSEEDAIQLSEQLSNLLALGGFRLTKWLSNRRRVLNGIPTSERAKVVREMDLSRSRLPVERALGVKWDTEEDSLGVSVCPKIKSHTRRGLLSVLCSVYDPLGFLCPYVLRAKILFQDECRIANKGWDEPLEPVTEAKWIKWLDDLSRLNEFTVKRCLIPEDFGDVRECHLHHFSDASQDGFGCVSYARFVGDNNKVHCSFLIGKARLCPLKRMTIPRLELSAAVMAVQVDSMLRRELGLEIKGSTFWTDSQLVLQYIRNRSKRFLTFVANRVAVIHGGSNPDQWRHVRTDDNPADDASRGLDAAQLVLNKRWKNGPSYLWESESIWPTMPDMTNLLDNDREVKKEAKCHAVKSNDGVDVIDLLINRYSSWLCLRKAVAWILRFASWLRRSRPQEEPSRLTVEELCAAEQALVKYVQGTAFRSELRDMNGGQVSVKRQSPIYSLHPYVDDHGVLRVGGRLRRAHVENDQKFPAILPKGHRLSALIVQYTHESQAGHGGKNHVLSLLRRRYWIPQPRPLINRVLKGCFLCKRLYRRPEVQRMADLPEARVTPDKPPFSYVGLDCFGPFSVKRGRSREKRYGCLFTCMATRAIHLEMLHSLDADSFINGVMRFAARRGTPECVYSDNGTNFVSGERELRDAVMKLHKDQKVNGVLLAKQITWHFNPPTASHMGGSWERQIRTVRKVLVSLLKDMVLDDERLYTLLCEVESIVNDRPLTSVSDDPNDLEALTPSHLLKFRSGHPVPMRGLNETDRFRRRWKHVQLLAEMFWKRWMLEYLPTLQRRQRWRDEKPNLSVGDLVLMLDDQAPRNQWPLARVSQTFAGADGLVRSVEVKTASGAFRRPITKLCLLERATP